MSELTEKEKNLLEAIKVSQKEKESYFKEVHEGKHPGKKLVEQRIAIEFYEVMLDNISCASLCELTSLSSFKLITNSSTTMMSKRHKSTRISSIFSCELKLFA